MKAKSKIFYPSYGHYKTKAETKIYFKKHGYFVRVYLWHSKRQLRQVAIYPEYQWKSSTMNCPTAFAYTIKDNAKTKYLGDVHFCAGEVSIDHVAHEVNHITTFWAHNNKYTLQIGNKPDYNERMAAMQGNFTREVWKWLCDQKVVIYF